MKSPRLSAPRRKREIVKRQIGLEQTIQLGVARRGRGGAGGKSEAAMLVGC